MSDGAPFDSRTSLKARLGHALRSKRSRNTLRNTLRKSTSTSKSRQPSSSTSTTTTTSGWKRSSSESPLSPPLSRAVSNSIDAQDGEKNKKKQELIRTQLPKPEEQPKTQELPLAPLEAHRQQHRAKWAQVDSQLGERRDHTELLHALGRLDPFDSEGSVASDEAEQRPPGERLVASLSTELWHLIARELQPLEAAYLALASRIFYVRLGRYPWDELNRRENGRQKIEFLRRFDRALPGHLLCFVCATYHRRTHAGEEVLRPAHVLNPLFRCPNVRNVPAPKLRIAPARTLPFTFVQLVLRAHRFSPAHGLAVDSLAKRWRRDGWNHASQYYIHRGHLLMRVVSSCFASGALTSAGKRLLLFSRDDYWPYFSVCAHWKSGDLMHICKCALSHVPAQDPTAAGAIGGVEARVRSELAGRPYNPTPIVSQCADCRPMRRCPACPTEYLVEIKLTEDASVRGRTVFRYAIIVTRWSDLGDGQSPLTPEWAACTGDGPPVDSFALLHKRAISGIFESAFAQDVIPGQRIVSLDPKVSSLRKPGESWY